MTPAINPTPPGSYMLRELKEVPLPDLVSWWPQTIGWKLLLILILLGAAYLIYRKVRHWWHNRYRREAIVALMRLSPEDTLWPRQMLKIVKVVMVYLDPKNASVYGVQLLNQMDLYDPGNQVIAQNSHFQQWIDCLENPQLSALDFVVLQKVLKTWLLQHQIPEKTE